MYVTEIDIHALFVVMANTESKGIATKVKINERLRPSRYFETQLLSSDDAINRKLIPKSDMLFMDFLR
ncbi:MAG: hypothetical protein HUU29_13115 [Planctomycetaceae bacterium]|nr:hypothetical protein [Planctomycetaceae bacterium]